ncbi:hypothetical protein BFW38_09040 [Terasakiispira papahanaumokuakeensis]|uniref:YitT family protein n=1 Tax=Terasakiispira papahanaumokuakeensis TaxID=197479 RepID=A0A1E2V9I3_9GAMM|nr:YitT family protein [Terasakiispira papahanaumokuakeensis]ODC03668.1 hypothetical protein BFW38_09040 [Terasakiispira papahanaumokuakeensis]
MKQHLSHALGLLEGCFLIALGVIFLKSTGTMTGGAPGMALLLSHLSGLSISYSLVIVALPFFIMAWLTMGQRFMTKSISCVTLVAVLSHGLNAQLSLNVTPLLGVLAGSCLLGFGMVVLFRHNSSMGGTNVPALWLEHHFGWNTGVVLLGLDALILLATGLLLGWHLIPYALLSVSSIALIVGRYRKAQTQRHTAAPIQGAMSS